MIKHEEAYMIKIYIREEDRVEGKPLYKKILEIVKEKNLSGVTIFKAIMGYGPSKKVRSLSFLDLGSNLPILIEIIETKEKAEEFLSEINSLIKHGLVIILPVKIVKYLP
jgi:PII-like signaling protein